MRKPKEKIDPKFKALVELSRNRDNHFSNLVFSSEAHKAVIATDGSALLARRGEYEELKVLSRVLDSKVLKYSATDQAMTATKDESPDFASVIPTQADLAKGYTKIALTLPAWLASLKKEAERAHLFFSFTKTGVAVSLHSSDTPSVALDANYLKPYAGQELVAYFKDIKDTKTNGPGEGAVVFLPSGFTLDTAPWLFILMPVRTEVKGPTYA